jgi:hypothetical protein
MNSLVIICIALAILLMIALIGWSKMWESKEYYRNRTFELSNGAEGSHLVTVAPTTPPPTPPKKPAPERLMRPLLTNWIDFDGKIIRKDYVTNLTKNPNGTINAVLVNGTSINTGLQIGEATKVLGISYIAKWTEEIYGIKPPSAE